MAPPAAPAPIVPAVSHLTESGGGHEPLSETEIAEMKEHLAFLRGYKDVLRLRLNAAEDLLVNGRREPSDRGVCRHLLGKVERTVIEAAIGREPLRSNPEARARMLAGAVRLSADTSVLLGYLEALALLRSRTEAAHAFAEVVRRIDFESLSANRLARLLHVLTETFAGHERVQVLFSLLDGEAFRRAFDAAVPALPPEITRLFAPLRAVHRRILESPAAADAPELLAEGVEQVLSAPDPVLRTYAEPLRRGILEIALAPGVPIALADRAASVLLSSLSRGTSAYPRLALRRAAELLARHADDRARAVLDELRRAEPGSRAAQEWLEALDAKRIGRVALRGPEEGRLTPGFWLDGQRAVWVRTAGTPAAPRLDDEARLQSGLAVPGVAPVVEHGMASAIPYVAVVAPGRPWSLEAARARPPLARLVEIAAVARILRVLALVGVRLPDADPARFLAPTSRSGTVATALVLADLDGAVREADGAATANAAATVALVRQLLPDGLPPLPETVSAPLTRALDSAAPLDELIAALDRATLASH